MDLVNKKVVHKSFGKGNVVEHNDSYISVDFPFGKKEFVFPDVFVEYLEFKNEEDSSLISGKIKRRREEKVKLKKLRALERERQRDILERKRLTTYSRSRKIHPSSQVVFWCDDEDKESVFDEWKIFSGRIKSGAKKGQPNRLARLRHNSACLLTVRDPDMKEQDRYIIGAYMVRDGFMGRLCEDGLIPAHSELRFQLSEEESRQMLFWKYYINRRYPRRMTWNTGRYRYFENIWMAQILNDVVSLKTDTDEKERIQNFFENFCQLNNIKAEELLKPNGSLLQV